MLHSINIRIILNFLIKEITSNYTYSAFGKWVITVQVKPLNTKVINVCEYRLLLFSEGSGYIKQYKVLILLIESITTRNK